MLYDDMHVVCLRVILATNSETTACLLEHLSVRTRLCTADHTTAADYTFPSPPSIIVLITCLLYPAHIMRLLYRISRTLAAAYIHKHSYTHVHVCMYVLCM
jgi:hypothetical protein